MQVQNGECYHPLDAYAQSMFANIIFAKCLAQRSIAAFSANPGSELCQRSGATILMIADTSHSVQTCVSMDEVASWLQCKREGENLRPAFISQS
jgi:hypothetical protein